MVPRIALANSASKTRVLVQTHLGKCRVRKANLDGLEVIFKFVLAIMPYLDLFGV